MSVQSWSQLMQNSPMVFEMAGKYVNRFTIFIDYIPLIGPIYNAGHALNLLMALWCGNFTNSTSNDNTTSDDAKQQEKSRKVREKGLIAIVTALIDILTICLAVGVIAFVCDCLTRIQTFAIVRTILILFIIINLLALTIGAKIISGQLILNVNRQLEDVNHVGTSMVKSVTITATAIEKTIETTDIFVRYCQQCWQQTIQWIWLALTYPHRTTVKTYHQTKITVHQTVHKTKIYVQKTMNFETLLNLITFGLFGRIWITIGGGKIKTF